MSFSIFNSLVLFLVLHFSLIKIACDSAEEVHALLKWKTSLQNPSQPPLLLPGFFIQLTPPIVLAHVLGQEFHATMPEALLALT